MVDPERRRGWRGVAALAVTEPLSWGALYYAFGALLEPMQRELGASRALLSGLFSLSLVVAGALAAPVARAVERRGPRAPMTAGALLGAAALVSWSLARGPLSLSLALVLVGAAQAMTLYEPAFVAVARWFPAARDRARALALLTTTGSLASPLITPLAVLVAERAGFRAALLVLAVALVGVALPLHALFLVEPVRSAPPARRPGDGPGQGGARAEPLAYGLAALASSGAVVFLVPGALALGHDVKVAGLAAAVAGLAQIPGRWLLVVVPARRPARTPALAFGVQALALGALALVCGAAEGPEALLLASAALGAAAGAATLLRGLRIGALAAAGAFGPSGALARAALFGRAAAPFAVGLVLDVTGAFPPAFGALALVSVAAAGLWLWGTGSAGRCT